MASSGAEECFICLLDIPNFSLGLLNSYIYRDVCYPSVKNTCGHVASVRIGMSNPVHFRSISGLEINTEAPDKGKQAINKGG